MHIVLYGATGHAGSRILTELLSRGHQVFEPGQRTGKFRLGKDQLINDAEGNSKISMEDYAIALVDELEKPQHERQRFTVGY